jgi:hypothetical protein
MAELLAVEHDRVEVELGQRLARLLLQHRARIHPGAPHMVHPGWIVGDVAATVGGHDLQLREPLQHAVEDQMPHRHRGVERVADHVGEVVVAQAVALGEAVGVHEHHHVEVLGGLPELIASPRDLGPDDVGADLAAPEAESLHTVLEFGRGRVGRLQRHVAEGHEPVGVGLDDPGQVLVHRAAHPGGQLGREPVHEVEGRRRDGLDVHAHLVHVAQPLLDRRQADAHVGHLLGVGLPGERVGESCRRLPVGGHEVLDHLVGGGDVDVAVDVDAQVTPAAPAPGSAAPPGGGVGTREEHARLLPTLRVGAPILRHVGRPRRP